MRNEEVLRKVVEKRSLKVTIWKRKARWIGHIMRSDEMLRTVIEGRADRKRGRGRKRLAILDHVQEGRDYHVVKQVALDRRKCRVNVLIGPAQGQIT